MISYSFGVCGLLVPTSCDRLPYSFYCSNQAKPQVVPFVPVTAGDSHLCVSLTRKSCQHAAYPSVENTTETPPTPFRFLIIAPLFAPSHLALWHQEAGAL